MDRRPRDRAYYWANVERIRAAKRNEYATNPDKQRRKLEYNRLYHRKNREAGRIRAANWRTKNRDKLKAANKRNRKKIKVRNARYTSTHRREISLNKKSYYSKHREKLKTRQRMLRQINPERIKRRDRARYQKNREAVRERIRKWSKTHPQRMKYSRARRRARKLGNGIVRYLRAEIIKRDGSRCHICKRKVAPTNLTLDHLIPIIKGGPDAPWNVAVAHRRCNAKRGTGRIPAQLLLLARTERKDDAPLRTHTDF